MSSVNQQCVVMRYSAAANLSVGVHQSVSGPFAVTRPNNAFCTIPDTSREEVVDQKIMSTSQ
jgi:bifunctional N-acetylglucosamine-1-phosphate-uridyltransferase/glucosamine-1-phosphate-acetyltransferase GlmU-like protein